MTDETTLKDLTGKLLIAMPGMGDTRFEKSVVVLVAHGSDGGMGLIINKPAPSIDLGHLLEQLSIEGEIAANGPIFFGGPVENSRGFVLHSSDYRQDDTTLSIDDQMGMTATLDILQAMANGAGPDKSIVALGYAGWGPGQLEEEIAQNGWLIADAEPDLVFSGDHSGKWIAAIEALGINPILLSAEGGRA
ncbi:YqgE/AlgH family protein [Palleronia abyssalis]|nr:YqgE/AlgH family protein [Palleronia abyssalis]